MLGFNPIKLMKSIVGIPFFLRDLFKIKKQLSAFKSEWKLTNIKPILDERFLSSGSAQGHYFHQDLLVATKHVDIGSRVDGFVAHVASFREIEVVDIREAKNLIPNINFIQFDMMKPPPKKLIRYCDSISALHSIEHFGLGRYNDPIHFDGYRIGLDNINKMLKIGGKLYFSVPIGKQRIQFNAHRIFSVSYLLELFKKKYNINSFSYVGDNGQLYENIVLNNEKINNNYNCSYGCGIFEMTRIEK